MSMAEYGEEHHRPRFEMLSADKYWPGLLGYTCPFDNCNSVFSTWVEKINLHLRYGKMTFSLDATNQGGKNS